MAISLGSIVVELLANTGGFITGMDKAGYAAKKTTKEIHKSFDEMGSKIGSSLQGAFASLGQFGSVVGELSRSVGEAFDGIGKGSSGITVAVGALGALGAAAIAAAAGFIELGKGGAELVEHLNQVSQKTGISVRELQIFQAAGATVNVSLDDMVIGMRKFGQALTGFGKGAAAQSVLRELGITSKDAKEALLETADAFQKMTDGPRKASDAVALFGKSGLQLIPLLNKGRDGIQAWEAAVDKLGPVIGEEAVKANEKYRASVEELSLSWDKVKVQAEQSTIPTLSKLTSWIANNFQGIKAGFLYGGFGAAAILKEQKAAQDALVASVKDESAAKDELLKKQEQIQASLQNTFELEKAGGSAALALEKARQQLNDDVQAGLFKEASAIQSQLPALQAAADLEAQRVARVKQLAASYASLQESFAKGGAKPLLRIPKADPTAGIEALFGPQPKKDPLEGAPDLGQPEFLKNIQLMPDLLKEAINIGKNALDEFYADWNKQAKGTAESINAVYDKQWAHFDGLFALGEITEEQFKDVSLKIERERQDGLKRMRQDTGTSTFRDAWQDMFQQIEASGKDFARSITSDIGNAIESLNAQLVQFVATGKGLSFKKIGQDLQANLFGSLLKKGESSLFGSLGGLFGLGDLGGKPDGSSASKALFVQMAGLSAAGVGALPLGNLGGLGSLLGLGGATTTGTTTPASSSGGFLSGIGGFLGGIASFFGGFLADGGDAQPGRAYIVGEKRPELFVPRSAGTIVPNVPSENGKTQVNNVTNHFHGVTDMDSFKRSQTQISRHLGRAVQVAGSRG
jgi:hypothetical protein